MKKFVIVGVMLCSSGFGGAKAQAAPGEFWEITSKMEMAGMPFAMPETTSRICIPTGSESDPRMAAGGKDNGPPGLRPHYHANYYGAFVIGPDGHNIEAVCHRSEA